MAVTLLMLYRPVLCVVCL